MGILIEKECFFLFLRNNFSYFNMECNPYRNLDALAERKTAGELLEPLDEQRLRDHQLRKLRRMWLKDQILSEREPLLPPKKENFVQSFLAKERRWWKSRLHFETATEYMYAGKHYNELPLWAVYKTQQAVRRVVGWYLIPLIPVIYYFKFIREANGNAPLDGLEQHLLFSLVMQHFPASLVTWKSTIPKQHTPQKTKLSSWCRIYDTMNCISV